jgi:hypothetical protein
MAKVIADLKSRGIELPSMYTVELIEKVAGFIAVANKTGERTTAWEAIQELFLKSHVAKKDQQVAVDRAGVHRKNRSTHGVGASESQCHGKDILLEGFSWKKASDATAVEKPPPPFDKDDVAFNDALVEKSMNLIPPLITLEIESVGGSHTNTFLRQVKHGIQALVPSLADANGFLNREELCLNRHHFKEAVDKGLFWFVMHWAVDFVWPDLLGFIQNTLNTVSRGGQSETEMMLFMSAEARYALSKGQEPSWDAIVAAAKASMPTCSPYMGTLAQYVQLNTGGELLADLDNFLKAFACNENGPLRMLGGEFIGKVATLKWGKAMSFPYVQNACLMTNLVSPKVSDGICKLLQPSAVSALTSKDNLVKVQEAEQLMQDARKLCDTMAASTSARTRAIGMLDTRCILHILKKHKDANDVAFESINAIGEVTD